MGGGDGVRRHGGHDGARLVRGRVSAAVQLQGAARQISGARLQPPPTQVDTEGKCIPSWARQNTASGCNLFLYE